MQAEQKKSGVSVGSWMGTQLLLAIPVVNIIMLIIWAITSAHRSKRNFCIAALIWIAIVVVLLFLANLFFGPRIVEWLRALDERLTAM